MCSVDINERYTGARTLDAAVSFNKSPKHRWNVYSDMAWAARAGDERDTGQDMLGSLSNGPGLGPM